MEIAQVRERLQAFANKHKIVLDDNGECGFGRPCVGFLHGDSYVDFNPCWTKNYTPIPSLQDARLAAPDGVSYYHKHDCFAVLRQTQSEAARETALCELLSWVENLEAAGELELVTYPTKLSGVEAMFKGSLGRCFAFKDRDRSEEPEELKRLAKSW